MLTLDVTLDASNDLARISHKHSAASPQMLGWLRQTAHFDPQSIYNAIPVEMFALFQETGLASQTLATFRDEVCEKSGLGTRVHQEAMAKTATHLLSESYAGSQLSTAELTQQVYGELRQIANRHLRHERRDHSLQPTALVHEAFLRLIDQTQVEWKNTAHFRAIASNAMRRVLLDHARARGAQKRGPGYIQVALDAADVIGGETPFEIVALSDLLDELGRLNARHSQIVELRVFGGLTIEETAVALQVSTATIKNDWRVARAWLGHEMEQRSVDDANDAR
jgi:RNA polymerase sigma-70 factor (ECF subfamily)